MHPYPANSLKAIIKGDHQIPDFQGFNQHMPVVGFNIGSGHKAWWRHAYEDWIEGRKVTDKPVQKKEANRSARPITSAPIVPLNIT